MPKTLFLVHGKPGSGKTTSSQLAAEKLGNAYHFSIGDEVRARGLHGKPSRVSEELQRYAEEMKQHLPIPHHLITSIVEECIADSPHDTIIADGYPQFADRLPDLTAILARTGAKIGAICLIDVSDDVARQRLTGRAQRSADVSEDDAYIAKRLAGFQQNVVPTIEVLAQDYPVVEIDGDQEPDAVAAALVSVIRMF